MENQHRKISGYRELTQAEIELMNEIKSFGPQLKALIDKINAHINKQYMLAGGFDEEMEQIRERNEEEYERLLQSEPERWAFLGSDSLQQGLMFLTRAVAQPTFF